MQGRRLGKAVIPDTREVGRWNHGTEEIRLYNGKRKKLLKPWRGRQAQNIMALRDGQEMPMLSLGQ